MTVLRGGPVTRDRQAPGRARAAAARRRDRAGRDASRARRSPSSGRPRPRARRRSPGNDPARYYPGDEYVDWVGTDFYSAFPNFTGLDAFYKAYAQKPFAFGEWAIWGGDNPAFVNQLFSWVDAHKRVQMMVYNQGYITNGPFRLNLDPRLHARRSAPTSPRRATSRSPTAGTDPPVG